jgi:prepilin-type N-terminal cleavage/methylation domain-containing protein
VHVGEGCFVVVGMRHRQRGFSLVELLVAMAIIAIILAVAIPVMSRARINTAETMVVREMHTIAQSQTQYLSQFGKYAPTLAALGPPINGGVDGPQAAHLIPRSLATGERNGYLFVLTSSAGGYTVVASPKVFPNTGRRTFYLDQDGIVHQNWGQELASAESPEFE